VQNVADPGYRCIPAVTVNATDADLLTPNPGSSAVVALGAAAPGLGFAFVQVPARDLHNRHVIPARGPDLVRCLG
jgi:hypothetical protein